MSPLDLPVRELAAAVCRNEIAPSTIVESLHARADKLNPLLNALTVVNPQLEADAQSLTQRLEQGERPPLAGVPVVVKDNIWVQGLPVTQGSRLFAGFVAPEDATAVAWLRKAGALIFAIGTCSEFACKGVTNTPLHGITRNPIDRKLTPGGSSGGPAVAVAAGIVPLALGTDAGGSSRRPPAHLGVVGFKPTQDAVPYGPGFAEPFWGISVLAPIAGNVADARAMFEVLSGRPGAKSAGAEPRIAFAPSLGLDIAFDVDVANALEHARGRISEDFIVDDAAPQWPSGVDVAGLMPIQFAGLAMLYGDRWRATPELFDPDIGAQIDQGLALSGSDVARALEASRITKETLRRFLSGYDFLVSATTPCAAWTVDALGPAEIGGRPAAPRDHAVLTPQVNHAGLPAISIPCGRTTDGLPIGLQIIGRAGEDMRLLDVAGRFEKVLSYQRTRDLCGSS